MTSPQRAEPEAREVASRRPCVPSGVHIWPRLPEYEDDDDNYHYHDEESASDIHSHLPVCGLLIPGPWRVETV